MAWHRGERRVTSAACPSASQSCLQKPEDRLSSSDHWEWRDLHPLASCLPALSYSLHLSSLPCPSSLDFLSSYEQPEGNLSWPSSIPFA